MRRWLTVALAGLVLSCQGPAAVMAREEATSSAPDAPVPMAATPPVRR